MEWYDEYHSAASLPMCSAAPVAALASGRDGQIGFREKDANSRMDLIGRLSNSRVRELLHDRRSEAGQSRS